MKNVMYHQEGKEPMPFVVLKANDDKTVDIGLEGGPAVVTSCVVTDKPVNGSCTIADESKPEEKGEKPAKAKKAKE
jgi:hypothetical protein